MFGWCSILLKTGDETPKDISGWRSDHPLPAGSLRWLKLVKSSVYSILGGFLRGGSLDPPFFSISWSVDSKTYSFKDIDQSSLVIDTHTRRVYILVYLLVIVSFKHNGHLVAIIGIRDARCRDPCFEFIFKPSLGPFGIDFYRLKCWTWCRHSSNPQIHWLAFLYSWYQVHRLPCVCFGSSTMHNAVLDTGRSGAIWDSGTRHR